MACTAQWPRPSGPTPPSPWPLRPRPPLPSRRSWSHPGAMENGERKSWPWKRDGEKAVLIGTNWENSVLTCFKLLQVPLVWNSRRGYTFTNKTPDSKRDIIGHSGMYTINIGDFPTSWWHDPKSGSWWVTRGVTPLFGRAFKWFAHTHRIHVCYIW